MIAPSYAGSCVAGPDHGGLVWLIVPEDDGLGRHSWPELRLGSRLLCGDLLLARREVLCCLGNKNRVPRSFQGVRELDVLGLTRIGGMQISVDREDPFWSWHLQKKIRVVGDRHELGKGGSSQDGMVGGLKLGELKVDVLGAVVVAIVVSSAEGDRQGDRPTGVDPAPVMMS